jgi:hypothetical protein
VGIVRLSHATVGDVARIDRTGKVHASPTSGPWGGSLVALPWEASPKSQTSAVTLTDTSTIVLPVDREALAEFQDAHREAGAHSRVHNLETFANEAFEWQLSRTVATLLDGANSAQAWPKKKRGH